MLKRLFFRKKCFGFASVAAAVLFLLVNVSVTNAGDFLDLSGGGVTKVVTESPQARQFLLAGQIVCQPAAGSASGGFKNSLPLDNNLRGSALTDSLDAGRQFSAECFKVDASQNEIPGTRVSDTVAATVVVPPVAKNHDSALKQLPTDTLTLKVRKAGVNPYTHGPLTVDDGDFVDLAWNYTDAGSCAASWKPGTLAAVDSDFSVGPLRNSASPYIYKVTCGAMQDSVAVNVTKPFSPPTFISCQLGIRPAGGVYGKTATVNAKGAGVEIEWRVFGDISSVSLFRILSNGAPDGENLAIGKVSSGTLPLSYSAAGMYVYKLTATNTNGSQTCGGDVNVQVNPAPNPDLMPTAPPTVIGPTNPNGAFVSGKEIIISARPKNVGGGDAGKFNVRFQYKLKDQQDESYRVFKKPNGSENFAEVTNGLGAGLTAGAPVEISQISDKNDANTYEFRYCVDMPPDSPGQVNETQISDSADAQAVPHVGEYNNCSESATVRFAPPPPPPNVGCPPNCVPPPKPPPSSGPLSITCSVLPNPIDLAKVFSATWTASPSGGVSPYYYRWMAADSGSSFDINLPYPPQNQPALTDNFLKVNYNGGLALNNRVLDKSGSARGLRGGKVEVTDSSYRMEDAPQNVTAKCGAPGTISSPVSVSADGSLLATCSVSKILTDAAGGKYVTWTADTKDSGTSPYSYVWKVGDLPAQTTNRVFVKRVSVKVNADKDVIPPSFKQGLVVVSDSAQNKILEPKTETADCEQAVVFNSDDDYELFVGKTATMNFIGESAASNRVPVTVSAGWFDKDLTISASPSTIAGMPVTYSFYRHATPTSVVTPPVILPAAEYTDGLYMVISSRKFIPVTKDGYVVTVHSYGGGKSHDALVNLRTNDSRPAFQNF